MKIWRVIYGKVFDVWNFGEDRFRAKVSEVLDFLHEVNGDKFKQSDDEITKRLDCIVSVSDFVVTKVELIFSEQQKQQNLSV